MPKIVRKKDKERFMNYIAKTPDPNDCWIWIGSRNATGYGHFFVDGKLYRANRLSYELYRKAIPKGHYVLHKCDNRSCVNPRHLFTGTQLDNMKDMVKKNRAHRPIGEKNGRAKLTTTTVHKMKKLYQNGMSQPVISKKFNVSLITVWRAINNVSWQNNTHKVGV